MTGTPVRLDLSSPSRGGQAAAALRRPHARAAGRRRHRAGREAVPRQAARDALLHAPDLGSRRHDGPAGGDAATSCRGPVPAAADERALAEADGGTTVKTLWNLFDGVKVESVLMRYPDRATLCVTSQAGCGMACPFCATGQMGLTRNLSTAEIVEQVRVAARSLAAGEVPGGPTRLSNVVFMGMGEPLANYKAGHGDRARASSRPRRTASACRLATSPCRPSASSRPSTGSPTRASP